MYKATQQVNIMKQYVALQSIGIFWYKCYFNHYCDSKVYLKNYTYEEACGTLPMHTMSNILNSCNLSCQHKCIMMWQKVQILC